MNIPFYNIDRYYRHHKENINELVEEVFDSGKVLSVNGVSEFEENISSYCNRKYAVSVGSCTDALFFALSSCGITTGDEVIISGFSFIASVTPILRAGAVPVFVDIDPDYFTMDVSHVEAMITPKTKAILAVHLFGQMLPVHELFAVAQNHNLVLIEDAAQALGSEYNGMKAGSTGQCSCISFDPSKIISCFGTGGVLLTDDEDIYKKALSLRYHGKNSENGDFEFPGYNSRMSSLQAAIACYQLTDINRLIYERNKIANKYMHAFNSINQITPPSRKNSLVNIYHKYVVKAEKRDELAKYLKNNGIEVMIHYSKALSEYGMFKNHPFRSEPLKYIHEVKKQVLSLPVYPELTDEETDYIISKVIGFYS